jgi:hypothetical protein
MYSGKIAVPPGGGGIRIYYSRGRSMLRRMGWVLTKGLGARGLGTKTPLAHIITPPHPMFRSAVEVPDVNAIINTRRPHPVVASVEGRQWLSLPHTTIQIQGTPLISLLDSGSEVTCINEENFIALKARDTIHTAGVHISSRGCYQTTEFADQVARTTGVHHFRPNLYQYPCREKPNQTRCYRNRLA